MYFTWSTVSVAIWYLGLSQSCAYHQTTSLIDFYYPLHFFHFEFCLEKPAQKGYILKSTLLDNSLFVLNILQKYIIS